MTASLTRDRTAPLVSTLTSPLEEDGKDQRHLHVVPGSQPLQQRLDAPEDPIRPVILTKVKKTEEREN